ncbi:MAG: PTS sugar transporter subunit IIC [Oscillospiraceae bacterium]|nr:PTS sugar transporter subunit IIC [Oscillospiraceae bacterium]
MFVTSLILGFVGVFCILDSRLLGRLNFERPLITCTIVGLLLGNIQTGLAVGASIELMSLGLVVIGAAAPPDMNMAAIICSAFAILTDASTETALALAIPIAVLGQMIGVLMRTILSNLTHVADRSIEQGNFRRARSMHIVWGTLLYSLMYFVPIFLAVYLGTDFVQKLVEIIPAWLTDGLNLGSKFLTAYGIALLMSSMLNKDLTVYFLLGFFLVGYIGLNITAIAIFASILAIVLTGLKFRSGPAVATANGAALADDYDPLEDDDDL